MPLLVQLAAGSLAILGCILTYAGTIFPAAPKWVALVALAFLGILCWKRHTTTTLSTFLMIVLFAWLWFTGWWAVDVGAHTLAALRMTVLVAIAISVTKAPKIVVTLVPRVAAITTIGALILIPILPVSWGGFGNQNAVTSFLILSAVLSWGCRGRWSVIAFIGTFYAVAYLTIENKSILEYAVFGFVAVVMAAPQIKSYRTAMYFGLLIGTIAWAIALDLGHVWSSFHARLEIWRDAIQLIAISPWIGNGLGGFNYLHGDVQTTEICRSIFGSPFMMPGAVHNDLLQLIIEGGLIGFGISLALIAALWKRSRNAGLHVHLTLLAGLALMLGDFALQQPDTGLMIALAVGLAARSETEHVDRWRGVNSGEVVGASILAALLVVAAAELTASWKAEMMFSRSIIVNASSPPIALTLSRKALQIQPRESYIRRFAAIQLASAANWCDLNPKCESTIPHAAADEIYRVAQTAGPGFVGLLVSRAQYLLNSGRGSEPELEEIVARLESSFPLYTVTWIIKAWTARQKMEVTPLIKSLERLSEMGLTQHNKVNLRRLLSTVTITPNPLAGKLED